MRPVRLAVVGFGELGRACCQAAARHARVRLAGVVRRPAHAEQPLPVPCAQVPVAAHISELGAVDAALLCVPVQHILGVAHDLLQQRIPVVECGVLHGAEFAVHKRELDRMASHYHVPVAVGAGWDPGLLSLFRALFALATPKGHTELQHRAGLSLHHTALPQSVQGVREALCAEARKADGGVQRYVYVELQPDADARAVAEAVRGDPLFAQDETLVFPVPDIGTLLDEAHGVLLERRGGAAGIGHQLLLLEARFREPALSAEIMLAAAQALPRGAHRALSLFDLPLGALWGEYRAHAESEWM